MTRYRIEIKTATANWAPLGRRTHAFLSTALAEGLAYDLSERGIEWRVEPVKIAVAA
jgi:hypothetical protein